MVAWKAVSKQATAASPGSSEPTRSRASRPWRWCRGARSASSSRPARTASSTTTGRRYRVPPCTIRWPTASTSPSRAMAALSSPASRRPPGASSSSWASRRSSAETTDSLRLLEPALTASTRTSVGPGPVPDRRRVLAVGPGVGPGGQALVGHLLAQAGLAGAQAGHPVDHVHDQVEPVQVVEHDHVEGGGGGPLLLVAPHVEAVVVGPAVGEAVDQPGVAVVGEDHRAVRREQGLELRVRSEE